MLLSLTPNYSKISSKIVLNKDILLLINRFFPGNNLPNVLFKGVSGSFTMQDKFYGELIKKKQVLAWYLLHYISNLPKRKIETVQQLYDNASNFVLSRDNLCNDPKMQTYGQIFSYAPHSFLFPWNQNFLSHKTFKQHFPIENVVFSGNKNLNIDPSQYATTGMTIQNFLEYKLMEKPMEGLYQYYLQKYNQDNIKFVLVNPALQQQEDKKIICKTQRNPDAIAKMFIVENGIEQPPKDIILNQQKDLPLDIKIIHSPENNLSPLAGNISVSSSMNLLLYIDRLIGSLTVYAKKDIIVEKALDIALHELRKLKKDITKEINTEIVKTEKELNTLKISYDIKKIKESITETIVKKNLNKFYELLYKINCDPNIKDIFPSIIYFNTYNETNNLSKEMDQLKGYLEQVSNDNQGLIKYNIFPQYYFIPMGNENDENYRNNIHKFLSRMPNGSLKNSLTENYELFLDSLNSLTNTSLTWKI